MLQKLNYLLYRFKYTNAPKLNLSKPVDVSLELSSYCTSQCVYCYHSDPKKLPFRRGMMTKDLAFKVISECASLGVNSLKWNYRGEGTMNPHFLEITDYAKRLHRGSTFIDRVLNSNFNFASDNRDIFQGLLNQTKVKVSFDSFRKDIFEKQRYGSKYDRVLKNMQTFHDWPNRTTQMVVQAVRTKLNSDEDLAHEIKTRFPNATASIRDVVEGRVNKDVKQMMLKERDLDNRQSCIQAHARLIINHDGKVTVCCPDIGSKIVVGDANKEHVKDIWKSKAALEIRQALKDKTAFNKSPCSGCSSFESYSGYKAPWHS